MHRDDGWVLCIQKDIFRIYSSHSNYAQVINYFHELFSMAFRQSTMYYSQKCKSHSYEYQFVSVYCARSTICIHFALVFSLISKMYGMSVVHIYIGFSTKKFFHYVFFIDLVSILICTLCMRQLFRRSFSDKLLSMLFNESIFIPNKYCSW